MQFSKMFAKFKFNGKVEAWLFALLFVLSIAFYITLYTASRESLGIFLVIVFLIEFFVITKLWLEMKSRFSLKVNRFSAIQLSLGYFFLGTILATAFLVAEIVTYEVNGVEFFSKAFLKKEANGESLLWRFLSSKLIALTLTMGAMPSALVYATVVYITASLIFIKKGRKLLFLNWSSLKRVFVLFLSALIHVIIFSLPIFVMGIFWQISDINFIYTFVIVLPLVPLVTWLNYYLARTCTRESHGTFWPKFSSVEFFIL